MRIRVACSLLCLALLGGCTATLTTGQLKLDFELKEYARKPVLDYVSSLLQKDVPTVEGDEQTVEPGSGDAND